MRAWVAVIAMLSVLALGAGCRDDAARDHGHAAHAHAVLVSKLLAKRRPAPVRVEVPLPDPVVLALHARTYTRIAPRPPLTVTHAEPVSRPGARAPPCA